MLLTVDVGNTNTVLGLFDGDHLYESYRIKTDPRVTADELALMFRGLLSDHQVPDGIAVCSTVPSVLDELRRMFARYFKGVQTVVVGPGVRTGVPLLYDNPREVGPDRIVNTLAAHTLYGGPAVVVDFGTSTNFDVVSAKGGPRGERVHRDLDAGGEGAAEELALRAHDVEVRRRAEVHHDGRPAVEGVCGKGVDHAVRAHLARVVVEQRDTGLHPRADHDGRHVGEVAVEHPPQLLEHARHGRADRDAVR